jgi:tetratricopeptide (TPR) repeat protein
MKHSYLLVLAVLSLFWQPAVAEDPRWKENARLLPQYCLDRATDKLAFGRKWGPTFGNLKIHIHHYCSGLYSEYMAKNTIDNNERDTQLGRVVHQMRYVGSHCKQGCVLYPELHTRLGWALGELGQAGEAIKNFQLAIQAKKTYIPAYARLADLYIGLNNRDEARKVLETGLKIRPESSMLKRRLKELEPT